MIISPLYLFQESLFEPDFCDRIIAAGQALTLERNPTVGRGDVLRVDPAMRDGQFAFFPGREEYLWLHDAIAECIREANGNFWKFKLKGIETIQYSEYGMGHHYDWHADMATDPYKEGLYAGLTRKISVTVNLSDPSDYDGGEFEFLDTGPKNRVVKESAARKRGTVIVFPSFVYHRVTPVTRGVRKSLVAWCLGPPLE